MFPNKTLVLDCSLTFLRTPWVAPDRTLSLPKTRISHPQNEGNRGTNLKDSFQVKTSILLRPGCQSPRARHSGQKGTARPCGICIRRRKQGGEATLGQAH